SSKSRPPRSSEVATTKSGAEGAPSQYNRTVAPSRATRTLGDSAPDHLLVRKFRLRVQTGPDKGGVFVSKRQRVTIGTHRSNDFVLTDTMMSRLHCEIVLSQGRALVTDLGSRNGTRIDRVAVESGYLEHKQVLTLGQNELRFEVGAEETKVPLSDRTRF